MAHTDGQTLRILINRLSKYFDTRPHCRRTRTVLPILYNGPPLPPSKLLLPIGDLHPCANLSQYPKRHLERFSRFGATVCRTVRPVVWDRCLSCLSVCNVAVLWPNGWIDQDTTWYGSRPRRSWRHCVRWGVTQLIPTQRGTAAPSHFLVHFSGTVAHLSNCWALVARRSIVTDRPPYIGNNRPHLRT